MKIKLRHYDSSNGRDKYLGHCLTASHPKAGSSVHVRGAVELLKLDLDKEPDETDYLITPVTEVLGESGDTGNVEQRMSDTTEEERRPVASGGRQRRRQTNREASQRARERKLQHFKDLRQRYFDLECDNTRLRYEALQLRKEKEQLRQTLEDHHCVLPPETQADQKSALKILQLRPIETTSRLPSVLNPGLEDIIIKDEPEVSFQRQGDRVSRPQIMGGLSDPGPRSEEWPPSDLFGDVSEFGMPNLATAARRNSLPALPQFEPDDDDDDDVDCKPDLQLFDATSSLSAAHLSGGTLDQCADLTHLPALDTDRLLTSPDVTMTSPFSDAIVTSSVPISPVCEQLRIATLSTPQPTATITLPGTDFSLPIRPTKPASDDVFTHALSDATFIPGAADSESLPLICQSAVYDTGNATYADISTSRSLTWPTGTGDAVSAPTQLPSYIPETPTEQNPLPSASTDVGNMVRTQGSLLGYGATQTAAESDRSVENVDLTQLEDIDLDLVLDLIKTNPELQDT